MDRSRGRFAFLSFRYCSRGVWHISQNRSAVRLMKLHAVQFHPASVAAAEGGAVEWERADAFLCGVDDDDEDGDARAATLDDDDDDAEAGATAAAAAAATSVAMDAPIAAGLRAGMETSTAVCLIVAERGLTPPLCQAPPPAAAAEPPTAAAAAALLLTAGGVAMTVVGGANTVAATLGREAAEACADTAAACALAVATRAAKLSGAAADAPAFALPCAWDRDGGSESAAAGSAAETGGKESAS